MTIRIRNIFANLHEAARAFAAERSGNVAIIFAIATLPLIGAVGAAVDYSRANSVKTAMQTALDSTALMLSRDAANLSVTDLQTKASSYFNAMFARPDATDVVVTASYTASGGFSVVIDGSAKVPTTLMSALGYDHITVTASSTSKWGSERLRVALVLDNTGSMADSGKIAALQTATKNLLTQLKGAATVNGDVYVSIIPFNKDVNVDPASYPQSWIRWDLWDAVNGRCSDTSYHKQSTCVSHGRVWTPAAHSTWNGCITDRGPSGAPGTSTWDQIVTPPDSTTNSMWPAEQYNSCPAVMMGLSYDWVTMNGLVDAMYPNGNTNQPIGLVWGWQSLVGGGPLTAPAKDPNYTYKEIIILLSDGLNTADRWYSTEASVDNRMYQASNGSGTCANIRASGITIYSIQVNTGGDPTSTIMQNCASGSDKFFMLTSATQIVATFQSIGTELTKLRVAK